jgi:hypothetical protein
LPRPLSLRLSGVYVGVMIPAVGGLPRPATAGTPVKLRTRARLKAGSAGPCCVNGVIAGIF